MQQLFTKLNCIVHCVHGVTHPHMHFSSCPYTSWIRRHENKVAMVRCISSFTRNNM